MSLLTMGDLDAARPHALVERDHAERRGTPRVAASHVFTPITFLSCLEGDWKAGREYSDRGLEVSPLNQGPLLPRIMLEYETGESAQGAVYLERLLEVTRLIPPGPAVEYALVASIIPLVGRITGLTDQFDVAAAAAETVLSSPNAGPALVMWARSGLAELVHAIFS